MNDESVTARYARALAREGLDQTSPGLLDTVRRLHEEALTSGLVLRAYQQWRRDRRGQSVVPLTRKEHQ